MRVLRLAHLLLPSEVILSAWKHTGPCPRGTCSECWPHVPGGPLADALQFVARHADWLMHRPEAETAYDELTAAMQGALRAIDTTVGRRYVGPCSVCSRDLYAEAGAVTVECRPCRMTYDMAERRELLLTAAEDRIATAAEISRAVTNLWEPVTSDRIRQWAARGRLVAHAQIDGRPGYRVGDVLDLLRDDAKRRRGAVS